MNEDDDDFFDMIASKCALVLELNYEEKDEFSKEEVFAFAKRCQHIFTKQIEAKKKICKSKEELIFVYEGTFNFLMFSMAQLMKETADNESIEYAANKVRDYLLTMKKAE